MEINEVVKNVHQTAKEKGFWDDYENAIAQANGLVQTLANHQAYISQKLMLTVSELGEALEALRSDKITDRAEYEKYLKKAITEDEKKQVFEIMVKNTFEDEIADTLIRIFDLCGKMGIDIEWHLQKKMEYNDKRAYKHGRNF